MNHQVRLTTEKKIFPAENVINIFCVMCDINSVVYFWIVLVLQWSGHRRGGHGPWGHEAIGLRGARVNLGVASRLAVRRAARRCGAGEWDQLIGGPRSTVYVLGVLPSSGPRPPPPWGGSIVSNLNKDSRLPNFYLNRICGQYSHKCKRQDLRCCGLVAIIRYW